jgi:hypothetical protein
VTHGVPPRPVDGVADAGVNAEQREVLRLSLYGALAATGRAPSLEQLAATVNADVEQVRVGLRSLGEDRHVVLGEDDQVLMAHPFSTVPLGFAVMGRTTLWWGGCAWDSFALPHLLADDAEVLVSTRCPACGAAHAWNVSRHAPPAGSQVAHFLVPAARMWDDVVHTCANQRIFCSQACVDRWLATTKQRPGYVMDLTTLWRLSEHWYDGRLEPGYTRREPSVAANYFAEVGLTGEFWHR